MDNTNEDVIYIDDDILRDAYQTYTRNGVDFSSLSNDIASSGDINVQADLFGDGIRKLSRQSTSISSRFDSVSSIVSNSIDEWNMLERKLAREASLIEIPQIEELTDSVANYQYSDSILSKNDGISVNKGQATSKEEYDDSSTVDKEQLQDITKGETVAQEYNDTYNFNNQHNQLLEDITKGETIAQEYTDAYDQNKQQLVDITKGETVAQEYDASSSINNIGLQNINNSTQQMEQQIDFSNSAVNNINLVNIK